MKPVHPENIEQELNLDIAFNSPDILARFIELSYLTNRPSQKLQLKLNLKKYVNFFGRSLNRFT